MIKSIKPFILASTSPRRKLLLESADLDFEILKLDIDESYPEGLSPMETVDYLTRKKLDECTKWLQKKMVLTADTLVFKDEHILSKPGDREHAIEMLNKLSGTDHIVITSVCIGYKEQVHQFNVTTNVFFNVLKQSEIEYYVDNYKPFDKAGSYGIQEWIGHVGICRINGSYTNVVGLPVHETYQALLECNIKWF